MNTPIRTVRMPTTAHKVILRNAYVDSIKRGGIDGVPNEMAVWITSDIVDKTIDDITASPLRKLGLHTPRLLVDLICAYIAGGVLLSKIVRTQPVNMAVYHPGYIGAYTLGYTYIQNMFSHDIQGRHAPVMEVMADDHYLSGVEVDHVLDITDVFMSSDGYDALVEYIHNILGVRPYDEWYVKHSPASAICECYGDYRIRKFNSYFLDSSGKMKDGYGNS